MQHWEENWPSISECRSLPFLSRCFASNAKCQTVQVKHNYGDTTEEKGVLALGDSAMCESQVELFSITCVEAL